MVSCITVVLENKLGTAPADDWPVEFPVSSSNLVSGCSQRAEGVQANWI